MNRREFGQLAVGAALAQALLGAQAQGASAPVSQRFSVMLWTLEKQAPFDRCLEIVAEAGYQGVELTGQFRKWTAADIQPVMAKMRSLGLVFDLLSGVRVGFADPKASDAFLAAITRTDQVLQGPGESADQSAIGKRDRGRGAQCAARGGGREPEACRRSGRGCAELTDRD